MTFECVGIWNRRVAEHCGDSVGGPLVARAELPQKVAVTREKRGCDDEANPAAVACREEFSKAMRERR